MKELKLLYVEDNVDISDEVVFFLKHKVQEISVAYDGEEGLKYFQELQPDVVVTDIQMPKMNGIEMVEAIRKIDPNVPIIITTAFNEPDYLLKAINLKVNAYVVKPLNLKELIHTIEKSYEPIKLKKKLEATNRELQEINRHLNERVIENTKELKYLYSHEPITGLANFIQLNEAIDSQEFEYLLLLDITNFTLFNKQYGKKVANTILKMSANELKKHMNDNTQLYKIESDKFVILSKEKNDTAIEAFCEQIISYFDVKPLIIEDTEISINFSIGIERIHENRSPLVNAEYAIDMAKSLGGRFFYFYNEDDKNRESIAYEIGWLNITREMIKANKIEAYYQPIIDVKSGKIVKYEVLARGEYNGEMYSPYYFIGAAEKLGIVDSITRIIVNKSFAYCSDKDVTISINITQRDLLDEYLIVFFEEKLRKYNMKAQNVTLEILENITIGRNQEKILKRLAELKEMGFKIAIDDFGVANSNFSRLLELKFDFIKLDAVFIKDIPYSQNDRTIVSAIVSMAKSLGIQTIAEYVESEEILDVLKNNGVDMAQGYLIGKPKAYI